VRGKRPLMKGVARLRTEKYETQLALSEIRDVGPQSIARSAAVARALWQPILPPYRHLTHALFPHSRPRQLTQFVPDAQ